MKKREKKETKSMVEETQPQEKKEDPEKPLPKPKPKTIEEKYQDALKEIDELKKNRMYLQAEMENSQKIALKRIENSKYDIKVNVIRNFLPIVDSFEAAISKYQTSSKKEYDQLLDGIKSLEKQFLQVLKGLGIKPIEQLFVPFNYKEHDVFMKLVDEEQPEDTVIKIAQKGYYLGENVLRPAKVIVSKKKDKPKDVIIVEAEDVDVKEIAENDKEAHSEENTDVDSGTGKPDESTKSDYIS
jgi:molecular chaperone GrpE